MSENMLDVFTDVKSIVNANRCGVSIDSAVFRLHWRFTSFLLISSSAILTARQYVGEPIDCLIDTFAIPASMINTYCWVSSTFLVPSALEDPTAAYSGIDSSPQNLFERQFRSSSDVKDRQYYPYYQWIGFILLAQGACFYIPHYFWARAEGGLMRSLVQDLQITMGNAEEKVNHRKNLALYLINHWNMFRGYALRYLFYETLSLGNLIVQILFTDAFLDGQFLSYGLDFLRQHYPALEIANDIASGLVFNGHNSTKKILPRNHSRSMARVFPRMTKCTFYLFGSSGDVQSKDALCLLPLNIFHEKVYLFMWFWLFGLLILSIILLISRLILLPASSVRYRMLKMSARFVPYRYIEVICAESNIGDYFIISCLLKNLDPIIFHDLVVDVGGHLIKLRNHDRRHPSLKRHKQPHLLQHHQLGGGASSGGIGSSSSSHAHHHSILVSHS